MRVPLAVILLLTVVPADAGEPGSWPGVLLSADGFEVTAPIEGTVRSVAARLGDPVERGSDLLAFDADALRRELEVARAEVSASRSALEQSRIRASMAQEFLERRQRQAEVFSKEEIREAELDARLAAAAVRTAEAEVARHEARLARAGDDVGRSRVRAPVAGRVAAVFVEGGQFVSRGDPLVRVVGNAGLSVRFAVPPDSASGLAPGDPIVVDAGTGVFGGVVNRIAPDVDAPSGLVFVEGSVTVAGAVGPAPLAGRAVRVRHARHGGPATAR